MCIFATDRSGGHLSGLMLCFSLCFFSLCDMMHLGANSDIFRSLFGKSGNNFIINDLHICSSRLINDIIDGTIVHKAVKS